MPWKSLGKVSVPNPGTPVSAVNNVSGSAAFGVNKQYYACQSILIQASKTNVGTVYIGDNSAFNKSTGVGLLGQLAVPTANSIPSAGATLTGAPAGLSAADYWIDADNGGDSVIVSILV